MEFEVEQIMSGFNIDALLEDASHEPSLGIDIDDYVGWIFEDVSSPGHHS